MKKIYSTAFILVFLLTIQIDNTLAKVSFKIKNNSISPIIKQVADSVVNIVATKEVTLQKDNTLFSDPFFRNFFDDNSVPQEKKNQTQKASNVGSGVIIDNKGYIITNYHVVNGADEIIITTLNKKEFKAKIIGVDEETDIAILKIDTKEPVQAIKLGNSSMLEVGDFVIAIGNPFGLVNTVTTGIISGLGRNSLGIESYEDFIQTDAAINRGNSGGALINFNGELIGINTAILSGNNGGNLGIGFAIPVNMVKAISAKLIKDGKIERGIIGIYMQDITPEIQKAFNLKNKKGTLVSDILKNSSAERVGIKVGDVIIKINDEYIENYIDLRNKVAFLSVGDKIELTIIRNEKIKNISLNLGKRNIDTSSVNDKQAPKKDKKINKFNNIESLKGVEFVILKDKIIVDKIENNSRAAKAGLEKDDVIVSVNHLIVKNFDEMKDALEENEDEVLFYVKKKEKSVFIVVY